MRYHFQIFSDVMFSPQGRQATKKIRFKEGLGVLYCTAKYDPALVLQRSHRVGLQALTRIFHKGGLN